jgi:hypothetical protein
VRILAIDPGPFDSGYVIWDGQAVLEKGYLANAVLLQRLSGNGYDHMAIERVRGYAKQAGNDLTETSEWVGRFDGRHGARLIPQALIRGHICGTAAATCAAVKNAIKDRFPELASKKAENPMRGANEHVWDALAVAVMGYDLAQERVPV